MKRIEFLAPVAAMRGNLGETQRDIVYPTHDNSAYDGPEGERNTARNYQPIIVGAKRANGRSYFCVKTKTSNHLTPKAKKSMAVMGANCAVYSAMKKDPTIAAKMDEVFDAVAPYLPQGATMRSYFMERIAPALRAKVAVIDFSTNEIDFKVNNPWTMSGATEYIIYVSEDILIKFWDQLAVAGIYFWVEGQKGIAFENETFGDLIAGSHNVLGLQLDFIEGDNFVKMSNKFVNRDEDGQLYSVTELDEIYSQNYKLSDNLN